MEATNGKPLVSEVTQTSGWRWPVPYRVVARPSPSFDMLLIIVGGSLAYFVDTALRSEPLGSFCHSLALGLFFSIVFVSLSNLRGTYEHFGRDCRSEVLVSAALTWIVSASVTILLCLLLDPHLISEARSSWYNTGGLGLVLLQRIRAYQVLQGASAGGRLLRQKVALITNSEHNIKVRRMLMNAGYSVDQSIYVSGLGKNDTVDVMRRNLEREIVSLRSTPVEEIFVSVDLSQWFEIRDILRTQPLPIHLVPDSSLREIVNNPFRSLGGTVVLEVQRGPLSQAERRWKRAIDVVLSASGLFVLAPLFLMVAVAIRMDSPGPILFRQTRQGFNGRHFKIYKFRSMTVREDGDIVRQATRGDARVTRVGRWLRRSSIDELPQLLNVLRGEMGLVGPRPHALAHDNHYMELIEKYAFRHHVKPGITGWAQVNGFRGETPTLEVMRQRIEHDLWYIDNVSNSLDIKILLLTIINIADKKAY